MRRGVVNRISTIAAFCTFKIMPQEWNVFDWEWFSCLITLH